MLGTQRYRGSRLYKRFYKELAPLVKPWQWSDVGSLVTISMAKNDLQEFVGRAKKLLPKAIVYDFEPLSFQNGGEMYVKRLLAVKRHLDEQRWDNACHELYDVIHFHCIQDRRILYTIIKLLEAYL